MFRCTTEVKGIAIDLDSFTESTENWAELINGYDCLFITSDKKRKYDMERAYNAKILLIDAFVRNFIPNPEMQINVLRILDIKESELAYLSANSKFVANALTFYSCVIYVTAKTMSYEANPILPDLICTSIAQVKEFLDGRIVSYLGEEYLSQEDEKPSSAAIPIFEINCDGEETILMCLGRYYGSKTYMRQLHPFSRIVFLNKTNGKAFRLHDDKFAELLSAVVNTYLKDYSDCICSVPARTSSIDRFDTIVEKIAKDNGLENVSEKFIAKREYPTQKSLSYSARKENVKDAFFFDGTLNGKRVIIIDDIITTGNTLRECAKTIRNAGASEVILLVLAINQKETEYCTANQPVIVCPQCGSTMNLLINSSKGSMFYACGNCKNTVGYKQARRILLEQINREFEIEEVKNNEEIFDLPF